jgi:hypothetical protein
MTEDGRWTLPEEEEEEEEESACFIQSPTAFLSYLTNENESFALLLCSYLSCDAIIVCVDFAA